MKLENKLILGIDSVYLSSLESQMFLIQAFCYAKVIAYWASNIETQKEFSGVFVNVVI
jgi:hypothetical protein